jgi:hypothetical protein
MVICRGLGAGGTRLPGAGNAGPPLVDDIAKVMALRSGHSQGSYGYRHATLHPSDAELVRDILYRDC